MGIGTPNIPTSDMQLFQSYSPLNRTPPSVTGLSINNNLNWGNPIGKKSDGCIWISMENVNMIQTGAKNNLKLNQGKILLIET